MADRLFRMNVESSTTSTRIVFDIVTRFLRLAQNAIDLLPVRSADVAHQFLGKHFRIKLGDIIRGSDLASFVLVARSRQGGM